MGIFSLFSLSMVTSTSKMTMDGLQFTWLTRKEESTALHSCLGKIDMNATFKGGRTPAILTCQIGHLQVLMLLIEHQADWNRPNYQGNTPLHFASAFGRVKIMALLTFDSCDHRSPILTALYSLFHLVFCIVAKPAVERPTRVFRVLASLWSASSGHSV